MSHEKVSNHIFPRSVDSFSNPFDRIKDEKKNPRRDKVVDQQTITPDEISKYLSIEPDKTLSTDLSKGRVNRFIDKIRTLINTDPFNEGQAVAALRIDQSVQANAQRIGSRPVLRKPNIDPPVGIDSLVEALSKVKQERLVKPVTPSEKEEKSDNSGLTDSEVERLTHARYHEQITLRQKAGVTLKGAVLNDSTYKKKLLEQLFDLLEEARLKMKNSKVFEWVSVGSATISVSAYIGGLIACVTGASAAALPGFLAAVGGVAALASAGTSFMGSYLKYQGNLVMGEAFVTNEKSEKIRRMITANLQLSQKNDQSITQLWASLAQLLRNNPKPFR